MSVEGYPIDLEETVFLHDGTPVFLRPIRPDDAPRLQQAFKELSPQTVFLRFLQALRELSDEQARRFVNIDYHSQMAIVAVVIEESEEKIIGVARYALLGGDRPGQAECAVVVVDRFQKRGLGTQLLKRLVQVGLKRGVTAFVGAIHFSNATIIKFIERSGYSYEKKVVEPGVWEIIINLRKNNHFLGALVGLAVGDALGAPVEFSPPGSFEPIRDFRDGGPFGLKAGQWTDDTSLALCLAESLLTCRGFDPRDQAQRYLRWYREGHLSCTGHCFDIGTTTKAALEKFEQTGEPFSGPTQSTTAGNGSLMRLAPAAMFFAYQPEKAILYSGESSRTTHGAREAVDACRYFGGLMVGALNGESKDALLSELYSPVPNYWEANPLIPEVEAVARGSFKQRNPPEIRGTGYVVHCLEAALWSFYTTHSFQEGCLRAVNLGDDADTTGAVYGQIAGAFYGVQAIPLEWQTRLAMSALVEQFAQDLFEAAVAVTVAGPKSNSFPS